MKIRNAIAAALMLLSPGLASANCWKDAATYHGVDVWLLYSIAWVESGFNPKAIGRNKNGTVDIGMMQINSIWVRQLGQYGISSSSLSDACTSVYVGAWILAKNIKRHGYTWRAIGSYNSANPQKGYKYASKVYAAHRKLTGLQTPYAISMNSANQTLQAAGKIN